MSLLKAARVDTKTNDGFTPLLLAAYFGHAEVCQLLLERGKANIEETTPKGNTALNIAAMEGHASTVAMLLSKGLPATYDNHPSNQPIPSIPSTKPL